MPQEEPRLQGEGSSVPEGFTGFLATYDDGTPVLEREGYFSERTRRQMATSWPEIDLERLARLDLFWHGQRKATILKSDHPHMKPSDWFFTQSGYLDMKTHAVVVVGRNIGYRDKNGLMCVTSVIESDGSVKGILRA